MRKTVNYINNRSLYETLIEYRKTLKEAEANNKSKPQVPKYIGEALIKICERLSTKGNFVNYTYRQDMIADGILDCIAAVDNFNPDKTENPFAYFTQIAWNAFLRRIEKEKKQTYVKHKNFASNYFLEDLGYDSLHNDFSDKVIEDFESKLLTNNSKKVTIKGIEKFAEVEDKNEK